VVTLELEGGATGADSLAHPAHIHNNSVAEGGGIEFFLSPVDGSDAAARSSKLVGESFDFLSGFDGHVNVHESNAALQNIVSNGNVGANGSGGGS